MPSLAGIIAQERQAMMNLMDTDPYRIPRREIDENGGGPQNLDNVLSSKSS